MSMGKKVQILWLVGASSGIGFELAKLFLLNGARVVLSARDTQSSQNLQNLKIQYQERVALVNIDVRDDASVSLATQRAFEAFGGIDLCFYNAGIYEKMKHTEWSMEHFRAMSETNYLGAIALLCAITPLFKEQGSGHIVFNASVASYFGLPYGGGYSAPKAALLNFCESVYPELKSLGIHLQVVNHGFVKTRLTAKNDFTMPQLMTPEYAAKKIYDGVLKPELFEIRFPKFLSRFLRILQFMPYSWAFKLTQKAL